MKTIAEIRLENLEILIREAGTIKNLAERSGISRVYISQLRHRTIAIETGNARNIGSETARKFEAGMSKPVGWMDSPHDRLDPPAQSSPAAVIFSDDISSTPQQGYITLEPLNIQGATWIDGNAQDYPEIIGNLQVLESWAKGKFGSKIKHIRLTTAHGTAMQPTINDGDLLFVDETVRFYNGDGIYILLREHMIQVKRLQMRHNGNLYIISDNPTYLREELTPQEARAILINGLVKAVWGFKSV